MTNDYDEDMVVRKEILQNITTDFSIYYKKNVSKLFIKKLIHFDRNKNTEKTISTLKKNLQQTTPNTYGMRTVLFSYDATIKTKLNFKDLLNNYVLLVEKNDFIFLFDLMFKRRHVFDKNFNYLYSFHYYDEMGNEIINLKTKKVLIDSKLTTFELNSNTTFRFDHDIIEFKNKKPINSLKSIQTKKDGFISVKYNSSPYSEIIFDEKLNIKHFIMSNQFYSKVKNSLQNNSKIVMVNDFESFSEYFLDAGDIYQLFNDKKIQFITEKEFEAQIKDITNILNIKNKLNHITEQMIEKASQYKKHAISVKQKTFNLPFEKYQHINIKSIDMNSTQLLYAQTLLEGFKNNTLDIIDNNFISETIAIDDFFHDFS